MTTRSIGYLCTCLALGCVTGGSSGVIKAPPVQPSPTQVTVPQQQHVNWLTLEQASELKNIKPVFIYVRSDDCGFCDLEDRVLNDPEVALELNDHYAAVKVNTPMPSVRFVPTIAILEPKHNDFEVFRVEHYVGKAWLLSMLQLIARIDVQRQ